MRRILGVLIAIALGVGVFALWPRTSDDSPPNTVAAGTSTTVTTAEPPTTSTTAETTTTTEGSHVVETVEEAEEILRELWFGWFEGIYNQDEDRIREVVVLEQTVETARESFGLEFSQEPEPDDLAFQETEILRSDKECLAVWSIMTISGFREGSSGGVHVLRWSDGRWERLSLWEFEEDLWDSDCDSSLP